MGHIHQVQGADFIGDLAHPGKLDDPRIGAASTDDHLGTFFLREPFEFVVVDGFPSPG